MKREIKFRLWDSKSHEWLIKGEDGLVENMVCCDSWDMFDPDDYVWCQYTGLKDKNGRSIYEGDTLKVTGVDGGSYVASVRWFSDEGYPAFDLGSIPETSFYGANTLATIFQGGVETCEVIGNIFENPELLEAEK
ncbi:hypothetical protein EVE90_05055 [Lacticaseibacillus paracasei]|uniref:YopX family protein n=1 Tax=Lacticaseibacillus paracasei TaxID=1597 RepID=UPI0010197C58|nr:YopX family protein [Lacticaseibacillus paracasei]QBA73751.1 hypothetical protein EVE90_05055 [Lacticaseibacillus paracasei]